MKQARRLSIAAAGVAAILLISGGAALASPMGSGAMMEGTAHHPESRMSDVTHTVGSQMPSSGRSVTTTQGEQHQERARQMLGMVTDEHVPGMPGLGLHEEMTHVASFMNRAWEWMQHREMLLLNHTFSGAEHSGMIRALAETSRQ